MNRKLTTASNLYMEDVTEMLIDFKLMMIASNVVSSRKCVKCIQCDRVPYKYNLQFLPFFESQSMIVVFLSFNLQLVHPMLLEVAYVQNALNVFSVYYYRSSDIS
eukprot:TRINITY_DN962_c0_g1_i6.p5 TRINITY_DN962_c0_g1~~TRINITY_DN962_c0_g1_i6.p5  ORF type:complete len:105 (-),score=1.22 TRINITY_DN962_c0_g1_i6:527-841(-)